MLTFLEGVFKPYFSGTEYIQPDPNQKVRLAKIFDKDGASKDPIMPRFFNVVKMVNPKSLSEVYGELQAYQWNPEVALVRAKPKNRFTDIRRNSENFDCSVRTNILHMDVDSIPIEKLEEILQKNSGYTAGSVIGTNTSFDRPQCGIEQQGRLVRGVLSLLEPEMFPEDCGFIAKASGSAGVKRGVRLHMYMESSTYVSNAQMKWLAYKINKKSKELYGFELLDTSVYDKVHLMYTAAPIFENPQMNPFKDTPRMEYVKGDLIQLNETMPEYQGMASYALQDGHYEYIEDIEGVQGYPSEDFENRMEQLRLAQDNVFMRHSISVYCSAVEEGVDIKWLDKEVEKVLSKYKGLKRQPKAYIQNAKEAALKIVLSRSLRKVEGDITVSSENTGSNTMPIKEVDTDSNKKDNYLKINSLPPENTLSFVKASLGTGKTTTVQTWLSSGLFQGRFISITNTVSLVTGNAKKLESGIYRNRDDFNKFCDGRLDRMTTTIHSLHRFYEAIENRGIDMLFIDECDAVMNDILFNDLIREKDKCIRTLQLILQEAKYVVLSDGDVSPETIEAYARLCDPVKPIVVYQHDRKMLDKATAIEMMDEKSIWAALQGYLEVGDKCLLVSDCSPDELNEKGMVLRAVTGANVKEVHKNSTKDSDVEQILTKGNPALISQNVDALLCSPSVTSGVDFNYFDCVFLITRDAGIHPPNLRFQALRRDRGAKYIFYYTDEKTQGFTAGSNNYDEKLGWLFRCRKIFAKRRENECKKYKSTFRMLLRDQGCKIQIDPSSWGNIDSASDAYHEERVNAILSSTESFQMKRHNDAFEIKQYIVRYYDLESINEVTGDYVERWLKEKPHDRAEFFHKVQSVYWPTLEKCKYNFEPFIKEVRENPSKWYQTTGLDTRTNNWRMKMYLAKMGIKEPGEFDNIISWYRTYCKIMGYQLPKYFMTESEAFLAGDNDALQL